MKINVLGLIFVGIPTLLIGDIDVPATEAALENIMNSQEQSFTDLEALETDLEKKNSFSAIISDVFGDFDDQPWAHPTGQWPIVDWNKVDTLEGFFSDQFDWIVQEEAIADTPVELAKLQFCGSVVAQQGALGSTWYQSWLLDQALAGVGNTKLLVFWYGEDYGVDIEPNPDEPMRVIDWAPWSQAFNGADDLGKAIILKNATALASRFDGWGEVADMHMLVFNGNNDTLKAIALVKGHKNLGTDIVNKWRDIVDNSSNLKLKVLAEAVLEQQGIEDAE